MKVTDIISRVRNTAGDTDVLQFTDKTVIGWINDAMREIAADNQLLQKSATQTTVPGTNEYSLPTDILKFHSVLYDGNDLRFITMEQAKEEGYLTNAEGTPQVVYVWASKVTLSPTPDEEKPLRLIYTRQPAEVSGEQEVPEIPSQYHMRLVDYCLAQVAQQDDDMNRYVMKMEEFRTGVQKLMDIPEYENNQYPYMGISARDSDWGYGYGEY